MSSHKPSQWQCSTVRLHWILLHMSSHTYVKWSKMHFMTSVGYSYPNNIHFCTGMFPFTVWGFLYFLSVHVIYGNVYIQYIYAHVCGVHYSPSGLPLTIYKGLCAVCVQDKIPYTNICMCFDYSNTLGHILTLAYTNRHT